MADAAWKKLKDKVTAKRGKKRDAGDTTHKGTGQNNYTRTGPTFGVGGEVLKDTTYLRTIPTTFYWLLNLS